MSEAIVANRYADALFQVGTKKNILDQLVDQFRVIKEVFQTNEQLRLVLGHPQINHARKQELIESVFQSMEKDVVNTLKLLVERGRVEVIPSMVEQLIEQAHEQKGIAVATVYSVRKLSDEEEKAIAKTIAIRFQKQDVQIKNIVDSTLIGGIKVRVGNTILDGSISGKLERMERQFATANK